VAAGLAGKRKKSLKQREQRRSKTLEDLCDLVLCEGWGGHQGGKVHSRPSDLENEEKAKLRRRDAGRVRKGRGKRAPDSNRCFKPHKGAPIFYSREEENWGKTMGTHPNGKILSLNKKYKEDEDKG